jgi:beta-glucosidase
MDALRAAGARAPGTVVNLMPVLAEDDRSQSVAQHVDGIQNRLFLDLLAGRGIPDDVVANTAHLTDWDFATDATVLGRDPEWLGVNYYTPMRVRVGDVDAAGAVGQDVSAFPGADQLADGAVTFCPREPRTAMGWEIAPAHLGRTLRETASALPGVPLIVNENGAAFDDVRGADGTIEDGDRITYLRGHLEQTLTAREDGVPVEGYFAWSLLDNLEWGEGRTKTFGLIAVDPATMDRTPKASASWFAQVCRTRTL